jgi:hypothetical protein
MLGDLIFETQEKTIGTRVLDENGTIELSVQGKGTLLGIECTLTTTRTATPGGGSTLRGEGSGLIMTPAGDFVTVKTIYVVGIIGPVLSARGIALFQTGSATFKRLNAVVGVFESDHNQAEGTGTTKVWEWK